MLPEMKTSATGAFAIFIAFAADQATKAIVVANAETLLNGFPIIPGFNLTYHRNDGMTFGLLSGTPWWALAGLAIAVCAWLSVLMYQAANKVEAAAYGAIIGGAFGNITDRLRFQGVTDFLDFYVGTAHWPTFNMADVFVVCGVGMLLIVPKFWQSHRTDP
ncbi:Lipoprotein signal peptidase [Marinibacterium anthonyi]|nr:Lipoprotein signal peptidase [Marinibacterium anthonyi]